MFTYQGNVAIKALELIGKELGMFARKQPSDEDNPLTLRVTMPRQTKPESNGLPEPQENAGFLPPQLWVPQSGPLTEAIASRWCQEPWRPVAEEREQGRPPPGCSAS